MKTKRIVSLIIVLALAITVTLWLLPLNALTAFAATAVPEYNELNIGYGDITIQASGTGHSVRYTNANGQQQTQTYTADQEIVITGTTTVNNITIMSGSPKLVLKDCSIQLQKYQAINIFVGEGIAVEIKLEGTNTLQANYPLYVSGDATLTIGGSGSLNATALGGPGIGGGNGYDTGKIIINSGNVTACGSDDNPGIGGAYGSGLGEIVINGGTVTATGTGRAAGIGSGYGAADAMKITINSGTVVANGGSGAAGIGGGYRGSGNVIINGGMVTATGGDGGPGIGSGSNATDVTNVTINSGTVIANGGSGAAGIGGGDKAVANVTISGGTVDATGGSDAAGIGSGYQGQLGFSVTISGGTVTATGKRNGAGIGGSHWCGNNGAVSIAISGGNVTATGGDYGPAAIGGGYNSKTANVNVTISGGTVSAQNDSSAASVGNGAVIITGGSLCVNRMVSATNGTANGSQSLTVKELTIPQLAGDTGISSAEGLPGYYGLNDVQTMDKNLYFYLPEDYPASLTTNHGETYYHDANGLYTDHKHVWSYATNAAGDAIEATCIASGCTNTDGGYVTVAVEKTHYVHTGTAIEPAKIIYSDNWKGSKHGVVTYASNTELGTATATFTLGTASITANFDIVAEITLDTNGGNGIFASVLTDKNGNLTAALPDKVTHDTLFFIGWYDAATGGNIIEKDYQFTGSTTIFAQFVEHLHSWTYTKNAANNAIIATCAACMANNNADLTVTFTLTAPSRNLTYDGTTEHKVTVTVYPEDILTVPEILYSKADLISAGEVTASITVGEMVASVTYTIAHANLPETGWKLEPASSEYTGKAQTVKITHENLIENTDFVVTLPADMTSVGDKTIIVKAIGNYQGEIPLIFSLIECSHPHWVNNFCTGCDSYALFLSATEVTYGGDGSVENIATVIPTVAVLDDENATITYWRGDTQTEDLYSAGIITVKAISAVHGELAASYEIKPKELTVTVVTTYYSKDYDGTAFIDPDSVGLDSFVFYSEGDYVSDVLDYDDVYDDVQVDEDVLIAEVSSALPGEYTTVKLSNIVLTGEDAHNYTIATEMEDVPLKGAYSDAFEIGRVYLRIEPQDQYISQGDALDQTKYTVAPEGYSVTGILLYVDDYGDIAVNADNAKVTCNGEDITGYCELETYATANLVEVCQGHSFNANGFCATGMCDVYEPAVKKTVTDEYGNEVEVYEIRNAGQLYWFAQQVNDYYNNGINGKVMANITVNTTLNENARGWTPIGGGWTPYTGDFDGNGYTISGLYFKNTDASMVGLFGYTDYGYTIQNVNISNSYFEANHYVGALIGYAGSYISGCTVSDSVTVVGNSSVGGIVGSSAYGELTNCWSAAKVTEGGEPGAGLVGYSYLTITNCYTTASKLVGYNNGEITNCYYLSDTKAEDGGKTAAQFQSGEVAYLLQSGIVGEDIYDDDWNWIGTGEPEQIWGQKIGKDGYPVLGGMKVYQVENCKAEPAYSNTNENIGHNYVGGACTVCGEADPDYVGLFNLAGANLELSNDITMYFYVNASDVADGYYMEIVKTNADGSKVTKQVAKADWSAYGSTMYYVGFNGMAAKEMADEIAVTVYDAEGTKVSNTTVTSISAYALKALDSAAYAKMHTLMADLLNYGAAAQTFFKYNTSDLANAAMTETHKGYATKGFDMSKYTNDVVAGPGAVGANLALETNILQNFFFDPAVVNKTMTAKVTYTNYKGVEKTAEISGSEFGTMPGYGYIIVEVSVLVPADVMSLVSVEIVDANGNVVASVSDSISSYAVRANTSSPNALYIELMEYCLSCEDYFG